MKIDAVDMFYFSMPEVTTEADGSQDALLVRVAAGGYIGWGECEAAPLPSIAAFVCPMSHGVCRPVEASVLGQRLSSPADIAHISRQVAYNSMDLLQAAHTYSGVEMALWDVLGKACGEPVWSMLGYTASHPKIPYASLLFGDTPVDTLQRGQQVQRDGFRAAKFGWGPIGRGSTNDDAEHFMAARDGLGPDGHLMIDVGQIFGEDVEAAALRLPALEAAHALWLEEPFTASAYEAYGELAARGSSVQVSGGEGAHNVAMARHLILYGRVGFIQIDCGRIGGIAPAREVADLAVARNVQYVNHTFTSHLALSASLQPYAGLKAHEICEYPAQPKRLAVDLTRNHLERDNDGCIRAPDEPGLGIDVDVAGLGEYLIDLEIKTGSTVLYRTPSLHA